MDVSINRGRAPTALHEMIYAHKNIWNELWIARFARTVNDPSTITFSVGSGYGHDTVTWGAEQLK